MNRVTRTLLALVFAVLAVLPLSTPGTARAITLQYNPYGPADYSRWPTGPTLNQHATPRCTVFAVMALLESGPFPMDPSVLPAMEDLWDGSKAVGLVTSPYSGVAVEWSYKYLESIGLVRGESNQLGTDVGISWLKEGPVIATVQWHNSMFLPDERGLVDISGPMSRDLSGNRTGHAFLVYGYDPNTDEFLAQNSWGEKWGVNGHFRIKRVDLAQIMTEWNGRFYRFNTRWYLLRGAGGGMWRSYLV